MQRHADYTQQRLKLLAERMKARIYPQVRPVEPILVSGPVDRISWAAAQELSYHPARLGQQFGPLWATFWFRCRAGIPENWRGRRVDLLWESRAEAMLWMNGRSVQGLNQDPLKRYNDDRPDAILIPQPIHGNPPMVGRAFLPASEADILVCPSGGIAEPGQTGMSAPPTNAPSIEFQIEMACNRMFGEGYWQPPDVTARTFVLDRCDIALFDEQAWKLYYDFCVLQQLVADEAKDLDKSWAGLLLSELNRFANLYEPDDRATWGESAAILERLYENHNATYVHTLSAIGHAHIDTAWLWPVAETKRKCERTFSSQTAYMDQYPDFKFACSQAQQYAWIKERNPDLWRRIRDKVNAGQFIPVGGTWIEPDCNIPSGESLCRQFLHGQRFFQREFGTACREFWNPDVFGYNGQLPQICRLSGIDRFLTQKLSWNRMNKPAHHTFVWEGIDGSELFTHFPPADTYNATVSVAQLRDNARNYKDHDRSRESYMLFGFGDGGGGPTKQMLETLARVKDLQGVPRTEIRSPGEFFERLEKENVDRARMVGELYFEYHRGTYTTQAATKRGNRKAEQLLHDIEFLATTAGKDYPSAELDRLWKIVLLNQFHDILPGSSIREVYQDAERDYAEVQRAGGALKDGALKRLLGEGESVVPVNTTSFDRREVIELHGGKLAVAEAPAYGIGRFVDSTDSVIVRESGRDVVLENMHLRATLSREGSLASLIEKSTGREALAGAGNQLLLYIDEPNAWDAWDVDPQHMETESPCSAAENCSVSHASALRGEIRFERKIGAHSRMTQKVRLDAHSRRLEFHCDCDWHESHRILKVAFPVNVRAMNATYEMQFGCVERPTHFNTTYDLARYEVPGHKWSDLSEHGFGVSLPSESKYGYSTFGNIMRMTLLRAPKHPDPQADMGRHEFAYAILPHAGNWREAGVVAEGYRFNAPLSIASASRATGARSFASVNDSNLVLDTIKRAEDDDAIILRFYECHGGRGTATVKVDLPFFSAGYCDVLERDIGPAAANNGAIEVPYHPFKIITLKLRR